MEENLSNINVDLSQLSTMVMDFVITYGFKLVGSILFLIIGLWAAARIGKMLDKVMERRHVEPSLRGFLKASSASYLKL